MVRATGLSLVIVLLAACSNAGPVASPSHSAPASALPTTSTAPVGLWPRTATLAYDSTRAQIVLFGGLRSNGPPTNDTWIWNGQAWGKRSLTTNPPARDGSAITDDPDHHVVVMFGGDNFGRYRGDTWLWDGTGWRQALPVHNPSPRTAAAVTYDPVNHVVLLFGGYDGGFLRDTWVWNGIDWKQKSPKTSPSARCGGRLAFDIARGNAVLYGGFDRLDDTWTWDGTTWTERHPANTPPGLTQATPIAEQMVYDTARKVIVFADPVERSASTDGNAMATWIWDGTAWAQALADSPPARDGYGLAYDESRSVTVLAGGWPLGGDAATTWGWNGSSWSKLG